MAQTDLYQAYSRASRTVAKTRQVVMLYDGAVRFLQQAHEAMKNKQIEQRYHKLVKASDVINGLQTCLDFESGGPAARVLYDFYASVDARIALLHRTNDDAACIAIIEELKKMREVWNHIDQGGTPAEPATPPSTMDPVIVSA